jgi:hypothetical protein
MDGNWYNWGSGALLLCSGLWGSGAYVQYIIKINVLLN